jgi:hypothetical protein
MGQIQIEEKVFRHLEKYSGQMEECHALYFIVELRKLLEKDRARAISYPLLRFYADWCVHTQKDKITPEIKVVADEIFETAKKAINARHPQHIDAKSAIEKFAHLDALRTELDRFLTDYNLPVAITSENDRWVNFADCLIKILEDQPIVKPIKEIRSIYFEPANRKCLMFVITFDQLIDGYDHYRYGNILY